MSRWARRGSRCSSYELMPNRAIGRRTMRHALIGLILLYGLARILQAFPMGLPMLWVVALHVITPAAFALAFAGRRYAFEHTAVCKP